MEGYFRIAVRLESRQGSNEPRTPPIWVTTNTLICWRSRGGAGLTDQVLVMLRGQVADIMIGSVFLFMGLAACCIAAIRRRSGVRIFVWLGIWSAMYGAMHLSQPQAVVAALPRWLQITAPYANTAMAYLLVVVGSLSFLELSLGNMRFLNRVGALVGLAIAVAGMGFFVLTGSNDKLMLYNNLLEVCLLLVLMTVVAVPRLSRKYLVPVSYTHLTLPTILRV